MAAAADAVGKRDALVRRHTNTFRQEEPGLIGIGTVPAFAIGQRALLLQTPGGNFLWDCISLLDSATFQIVKALGGLSGIAISHPHYYAIMVEWAHAFDAPVHLHAGDRQWVMRPDLSVKFWDGEHYRSQRRHAIRCGGHLPAAPCCTGPRRQQPRLALTGDIVQVIRP